MKKRTNVVVVVAFAVAAAAGYEILAFGETPVATRGAKLPARDLFAAALVRDGYPPALAGLVSAQVEEASSSNNQHHYVQTLGGGGQRELTTSVTPVTNYAHSKAEQLVTMDDGTPLYVTRRDVKTSAGGYEINLQFYMPSGKLSHELKSALGVETAPPITSNTTLLDRFLALLGVQSALGKL